MLRSHNLRNENDQITDCVFSCNAPFVLNDFNFFFVSLGNTGAVGGVQKKRVFLKLLLLTA